MEQLDAQGLVDEYHNNGNVVRICVKRCLNVLFGLVIKTKLAARGASLNHAQLQEKLSTNQEFHTDQLHEYNDKPKYNEHAWTEIKDFQGASDFQSIAPRLWRKSDAKLKELTNEYGHKIRACTKSRFHGKFEDLDEGKLRNVIWASQATRNEVSQKAITMGYIGSKRFVLGKQWHDDGHVLQDPGLKPRPSSRDNS